MPRLGAFRWLFIRYSVWGASAAVCRIALVAAEDSAGRAGELAQQYGVPKVSSICAGGARRQDSVAAGLEALGGGDGDSDVAAGRWVAVHDGARPCVGDDVLRRGLDGVRRWGAATAAVPVKDTIKVVDGDGIITDTPERAALWAAQTPQVFDAGGGGGQRAGIYGRCGDGGSRRLYGAGFCGQLRQY